MNNLWKKTRNFPFFFFVYLIVGAYFVFFSPQFLGLSATNSEAVRRVYLLCIWLTASVSFHFLASSIFALSKHNVAIIYNQFIPPTIVTLMLLALPLEGEKILQLCIALLSFFYFGVLFRERNMDDKEVVIQQFSWMCLFGGATFILYPRTIFLWVALLILGWTVFKQKRWFHLVVTTVFYFIPAFLYALYTWMVDDYFSLLDFFRQIIEMTNIKMRDALTDIYLLGVTKFIYLAITFVGFFAFYLYKAFHAKGLLLMHLVVGYLVCELVFFSSSPSYFWWSGATLLALLATFWAIQTTYYRLLTVLLLLGFMLVIC